VARISQVVVLAEDRRHQRFIRCYLKRLYGETLTPRFVGLPSGRGSGEQWVREHYALEVQAYRSRSARASTALIVLIDSDLGDLDGRVRQLRDALLQAHFQPRADAEKIVHLIPKRNIETWVLCLGGRAVDEQDDYRREEGIDAEIPAASRTFFEWSRLRSSVPAHCVPSLHAAFPEARRLE
jgi:hypothetical protein